MKKPAQKQGIDPDKVNQIVQRINYYAENEEKYIKDIITALSSFQSAYKASNTDDILSEKIKFITILLYTLLENRKNYARCLTETVNSYVNQNAYFMKSFNK